MGFFEKILGDNHSKELEELVASQFADVLMDLHKEEDISHTYGVLSELDFFPPEDKRVLRSGIHDIDSSNNFALFTSEYFEVCEYEELY